VGLGTLALLPAMALAAAPAQRISKATQISTAAPSINGSPEGRL